MWNFFFLNAPLKPGFWSLFGLYRFRKLFSFKNELASFEHRDSHWVSMTYIFSFVCLTVSYSRTTFCELPHAHHEHLSPLSWCLSPEQDAVLLQGHYAAHKWKRKHSSKTKFNPSYQHFYVHVNKSLSLLLRVFFLPFYSWLALYAL